MALIGPPGHELFAVKMRQRTVALRPLVADLTAQPVQPAQAQ
jgi:hypothetical protein